MRHIEPHVIADMAQRIGPCIAKGRRVGRAADAEAVENEQDGARHGQGPMRAMTGGVSATLAPTV